MRFVKLLYNRAFMIEENHDVVHGRTANQPGMLIGPTIHVLCVQRNSHNHTNATLDSGRNCAKDSTCVEMCVPLPHNPGVQPNSDHTTVLASVYFPTREEQINL